MISFFQTHKPAWKTGVIVIAVAVGAAIFVSAASIGTAALYDMSQRDRIMRGVFILQTDVSGLTKEEALRQVHTQVQEALAQELRFRANAQEYLLTPAENYIQADISAAVERAYASGRSSTLIPNTFVRIGMLLHPITLSIPTKVDRGLIERALREKLNGFLVAPQDASLSITVQNATATPTVTIHPERLGHVIDFAPALDMVEAQARTLTFAPIALKESDVTPALRTTTVEQLATQVPDWLSHAPFKLTADAHLWTVSPAMLAGWIEVTSTSQGWALSLSPSRVETTLNGLAKGLFQEPIDGILTLENGKLKDFQAPQEGILLNPIKTIEEIQLGWEKGSSTVSVILDTVTPKIMGADAEQLGIRERLGVGRSNFAGSPTNRRRNIAKGMSLAHGTLVGPDQEFSMLKTLGVIDGAHGWYPELVIKGNKTTPEFGGGLCQVGTTMFRAALNSGFPITERRNHSYRVSYYEPAGTDATIYDPAPDFRFKNDTGHWILVTSRIAGNDLSFTMWGTSDQRIVQVAKPKIYNIVAPPPKKIIESTDIPAGTTKCTESAHAGASASLDYSVTYPDGHTSSTTFLSYYKPWGAVCLTGVTTLSSPGADTSGSPQTPSSALVPTPTP